MTDFAKRITEEMDRRGLNTSEMAHLLGIPQQTLWRYINKGRTPTGKNLIAIGEKLKKSLDWLMGLTDDPGPASRTHDPPERPPGPAPGSAPAPQADPRVGRLPSITSADLTNLIEENRDLSAGARAMGEAHKVIADTNAELVRKLMEL